jgi:hypothetical protein
LLWFSSIAAAQEDGTCSVPFTEFELRTLVSRSDEALLTDDAAAHGRLFTEFRQRVACLEGQLPEDAWARLLLNEAIVRKVQGKAWIPLLDTALDAWSDLVVPPYLLEQFSPAPPLPASGVKLPLDGALFVDGVLAPAVPALAGEHVAQMWRDGRWHTRYLDNEQVPNVWLVPRAVAVVDAGPERWSPASRGSVGAILGPSLTRQFVSEAADWLGNQQGGALWLGLVSTGVAPLAGSAGVYWDAALDAQLVGLRKGTTGELQFDTTRFAPSGFVGPAAILEEFTVGVGGGLCSVLHYEGESPVVRVYPQPDVSLTLRKDRADFSVNGGLTPSALHAGMGAGSISDTDRPLVLRVGIDADLGLAWLTEEPPGDRKASALAFVTAFRLDAAWGRDR